MTNSEMGEIPVNLRGETHVMCFDLNGVLALCEHFEVESMGELGVMAEELSKPQHLRFVVATALRGGSISDCTEEQAGRLVSMGNLKEVVDAVTKAFSAATKSLESATKEAEDADPPVAVGSPSASSPPSGQLLA